MLNEQINIKPIKIIFFFKAQYNFKKKSTNKILNYKQNRFQYLPLKIFTRHKRLKNKRYSHKSNAGRKLLSLQLNQRNYYIIQKQIDKEENNEADESYTRKISKTRQHLISYIKRKRGVFSYRVSEEVLVDAGIHKGFDKRDRNNLVESFYGRYSVMAEHSFINVNYSTINFRKGLNFIQNSLVHNSRLLLVAWSSELYVEVPPIFKHLYFFKGPWLPGFISNYRFVYQHCSFWNKTPIFPPVYKRRAKTETRIALGKLGIVEFPNLLFTIDSRENNFASIMEAAHVRMPNFTFALPTHRTDPRYCMYPIFGTTIINSQISFFVYLLAQVMLNASLQRLRQASI